MSAKILAVMQKMDASLTLIADNFSNGTYDTEAKLQGVLTSAKTAVANATKAYSVLVKPAMKGRSGITAMATTAFDTNMTAVQQVQVKASLLSTSIQAELDEMEENKVSEEIEDIDFDEDGDVTAAVEAADFDDNGSGKMLEQESIEPTDTNATVEAVDFDDNGSGEVLETEEIVPTDTTASEDEGEAEPVMEDDIPHEDFGEKNSGEEVIDAMDENLEVDDLAQLDETGDLDGLFDIAETEEDEVVASTATATEAKRASAAASANRQSTAKLEDCWEFTA